MHTIKIKSLTRLTDRTRGLIGKKEHENILIKTRFGIHTFGLKFPIDVLILDKNCHVVKLKKNLKPNRILFWNPKFDTVCEIEKGTIEKLRIQLQDKIHFEK